MNIIGEYRTVSQFWCYTNPESPDLTEKISKNIIVIQMCYNGGEDMGTITIRVNDAEEAILAQAASLYGSSKSALIKQLAFERLEDEYDLRIIAEHERRKALGQVKTRPIEDLLKDLGL